MNILIVSDGSTIGANTIRYAALIALPDSASVTLLGVAPGMNASSRLQEHLRSLNSEMFEGSSCTVEMRVEIGNVEEVTLAAVDARPYDLVVIGAYQRRGFRRFLYGSTARYLAQHVLVPLLIVNRPRTRLQRILICTSAENPGEKNARLGGKIAAITNAQATMLHVLSQVALTNESPDDLEEDAATLIERRAREGVHLTRTLDILAESGIAPEKRVAKVRHGLVVDEIVNEARDQDYDLVVMGAHGIPEDRAQRSLRALLQENITDQILTQLRRPMLIVRTAAKK